jgi:hypothetical protein
MSVFCPKCTSSYLTFQWVTHKIHPPKACVCVTCVKGLKAVRKVVLSRCGGKMRGIVCSTALWSVPCTNNRISHHQWDVVRISPTTTLDSNRNVCKWHRVIAHSNLRTCKGVSIVIPNCTQKCLWGTNTCKRRTNSVAAQKLYIKTLMKHLELQEKINWEMEDIKG